MGKTPKEEAYDEGVKDGREGDALDDLCHGFSKALNVSERDEAYDKGYDEGVRQRDDYRGNK